MLLNLRKPGIRLFSTKMAINNETKAAANDFISFVNASPTPFHAVKAVKEKLSRAGFHEIKVSCAVHHPWLS